MQAGCYSKACLPKTFSITFDAFHDFKNRIYLKISNLKPSATCNHIMFTKFNAVSLFCSLRKEARKRDNFRKPFEDNAIFGRDRMTCHVENAAAAVESESESNFLCRCLARM